MKGFKPASVNMRRLFNIFIPCFLSIILGFWIFSTFALQPALAQARQDDKLAIHVASDPQDSLANVKVGVYVLNLGKLDTSTGSFTIDFYLSLSINLNSLMEGPLLLINQWMTQPINFTGFKLL